MMYIKKLKVASRTSPLAIYQTQYVCNMLKNYYVDLNLEIVPVITTGDKFSHFFQHASIKKGAFIKELEYALIDHRADLAVHSMKDITVPLPTGLVIPVLCKRDDPRDAFVSVKYSSIDSLPIGGIIGTSSLRRKCQILAKRPDLIVHDLRGNIDTRLKKLYIGNQYDAIILAVAGLSRLRLEQYIRVYMDPSYFLPAMGQGVIAIECRESDMDIISLISPLHHRYTALCVRAEQIITTHLGSYCKFPLASYAEIDDNYQIWLRALIGLPDGSKIVRVNGRSSLDQIEQLGYSLASDLLREFNK